MLVRSYDGNLRKNEIREAILLFILLSEFFKIYGKQAGICKLYPYFFKYLQKYIFTCKLVCS